MSLQTRLADFITAVGTDIKQLRIWITGSSSGNLTGLTTTDKSSLVAALNEVQAGSSGAPPDATTTVKGVVELATDAETITGTDSVRAITPSNLTAKIDTDETFAGNSDTRIPSQKAVKTLFDGFNISDASTTLKGKIEIATDAEAVAGTDTSRAVTPANVAAVFTDRIDTNTALGTSNTKVPSQNAAKTYIDGIIAAANAMVYKGVIDASANPNYPAADAGWAYRISVAGKIGGASGPNVEVGDIILCLTDGTAAGNQATVGANWDILQVNIDGAVVGPASSTSGDIALFSGTSGKIVQDSGIVIVVDGSFTTNSDVKVGTEKAVKVWVNANFYTQTQLGDPDTDLAAAYTTAKT